MEYLLSFDDVRALEVDLAGGKGANLAFMTQHGFPVPSGVIVTANAYRDFIRQQSWLDHSAARLTLEDPAALRKECEQIRARLARIPVPDGLAEEIEAWLAAEGDSHAYSVRSSATLEDTATAAFAGQHETFLNCRGAQTLVRKILECWLSLWADRAARYRHQLRIRHSDATMAVVVQRMVFCDVSGVGFTINPVSGSLTELVLDANYGLGESIVSGEATVDHWVIDKPSGKVIDEVIAEKTTKTVAIAEGVREEAVTADEARAPCLDNKRRQAIVKLILDVEEAYQFPQDVEWGFARGESLILQSRPITTIPERWTRDESAERFPTVITPLTWDLVEEGFHRSLNYSLRLMGYPPFDGKWFAMFGHYVYGNQNAVEIYGGREPVHFESLEELQEAIPVIRRRYRWVQELPISWVRDLDHYLLSLGQLMAEPLEGKSLADIWNYVLRVNLTGSEYFLPNIAISITQSVLYRVLLGFLSLAFGKQEAPSRFDRLLAVCDTKTGAINAEMFRLSCKAGAEEKLKKLLLESDSRTLIEKNELAGFPEFEAEFDRFLVNHGHREVEFDAYHPTWVEAPWIVLDNIRLAMESSQGLDPAEKKRAQKLTMQQAEFECLEQLPKDLHFFFHELVRLARAYTSLDDLEHYETTRLTLPLRRGLRVLGEGLVDRGLIEDPMDVFFAHRQQLNEALREDDDGLWRALAGAIQSEKAQYLVDRDRTPEWVLGEGAATSLTGEYLQGLPGSPGRVSGQVFRVLGADDFASFPKGAVLVARTTNPTWTSLFYNAAAVVTESGGPLSHGAVIAREMKIPAVTSVHDALSLLASDSLITVDGTAGKIYLDTQSEAA